MLLDELKNLWARFHASTPKRNKRIGKFLTAVAAACTAAEAALIGLGQPVPMEVHKILIITTVGAAIWAAYHGQKTEA